MNPPATSGLLWLSSDPLPELKGARLGSGRLVSAGDPTDAAVTLHDTFDGALARAGRLLVSESESLTLFGGPEAPLRQQAGDVGFISGMPAGAVREALASRISPLRRLSPIGAAMLTRQPMVLLDDLDKTTVRCDVVHLDAGNGRVLCLLRAEALRGYGEALAELMGHLKGLQGVVPLDAGAAIPALFPECTTYVFKPVIEIAPETTAFSAATRLIAANLAVARRNEAGIVADIDTEFLHHHRVALRRVRSVLSLFRDVYGPDHTADLKARVGALMARTGKLRDLDVYLIDRAAYLDMVPPFLRPGLERLFEIFASERAAEQASLAGDLESDAYGDEMRRLAKVFAKPGKMLTRGPKAERPARDFARRLIWKRYRKVCNIAATIDETTPDTQVHELRIQCKKLRYLMQFFAPAFPAPAIKPLIKALKRLQDVLGVFNDCSVQQEALAGRLEPARRAGDIAALEIARSIGALLVVLDQRQRSARSKVVASFATFDAPATRQGFRDLFKTDGTAP